MDWLKILEKIFIICIVPLLGILTKYLVSFINSKIEETKQKTKNEQLSKALDVLDMLITDNVNATMQTYVQSLKKGGMFDATAQKEALLKTYSAVTKTLNDDIRKVIIEKFGDIDTLIEQKIEAQVRINK